MRSPSPPPIFSPHEVPNVAEASSPFIPGTKIQHSWDSTSLGWFKQCARLYEYQMIEGWRSKAEPVHLIFGIWFHSALERYYKSRSGGKDHEAALDEATLYVLEATWIDGKPWTHELKTAKSRDTLVRSVVWYLEQFAADPAETVVLANGKPAVELSFKMELDWGPEHSINEVAPYQTQNYILSGHIDRLVTLAGDTFVMDHKTTDKTLSGDWFDQFKPDNQMTLYTVASQVIFHTPVRGVLIDGVQVAVGFTRFQRGVTYRNQSEIEEWLRDLRQWLDLAEGYAQDGYWPMNDRSCKFCAFRGVCSSDPGQRQSQLESRFVKKPWNPLIPR